MPVIIGSRWAFKHDRIGDKTSKEHLCRHRIDIHTPFSKLLIDNRARRSERLRADVDRRPHARGSKPVMVKDLHDFSIIESSYRLLDLIMVDEDELLPRLVEKAAPCDEP